MTALTEEENRIVKVVEETPHHLLNAPKFLPALLAIVRRLDAEATKYNDACLYWESKYNDLRSSIKFGAIEEHFQAELTQARKEAERLVDHIRKIDPKFFTKFGSDGGSYIDSRLPWETPAAKEG